MDSQTQSAIKLGTLPTESIEGTNFIQQPQQKQQLYMKRRQQFKSQNNELTIMEENDPMKQQSYQSIQYNLENNYNYKAFKYTKNPTSSKTISNKNEDESKEHDQIVFSPSTINQNLYKSSYIDLKGVNLHGSLDLHLPSLIANLEQGIKSTPLSNKKSLQQITFTLSIIAKLKKAVKLFKSYIITKKIISKQAAIINDISYFDSLNQKNDQLKKKENSIKNAYIKLLVLSKQNNNQMLLLFKTLKHELKQIRDRFLLSIDKNIPVIDAINPWKVFYDILKILITMFAIFLNSVEVFFNIDFDNIYTDVYPKLRYLFISFYSFCMFLSLNTALSHKGLAISNRKDIFKYYFRNRFLLDTISIISFIKFDHIGKIYVEIIKLLILSQVILLFKKYFICLFDYYIFDIKLKIFYIITQIQIQVVSQKLQSFQYFTHSLKKNKQMFYIVRLIKLLLTIILVAHLVAIVFYGQTLIFQQDNLPNWVNQTSLMSEHDPWYKKYIFALYFSVTTMMTVGYGDITPKNIYEAVFSIIAMVIACGVFAYSFNLIGIIIQDMNKKQRQFKKKINKVNLYLADRNISDELRFKVQKFLEYKQVFCNRFVQILFKILFDNKQRYKNDKSLSREDEQEILEDLSPHLLEKIVYQTKQNVLSKDLKVFSIFSQEFRDVICSKLKEIHLNKDEILFEQDQEQEDPSMYFIHKGTVEIYYKNKYTHDGIILNRLQKGQQFGEISFLLNTPRSASARIVEPTVLYSISKSDLLDQLAYYASEKEKYYLIINKMIFRQSNQIINQQCYHCHSEKHLITQCPRLHYSPEKDLLILKENYPVPHVEREFFRRKRRKESGYSLLKMMNQYTLEEPIGIQKECDQTQELNENNDYDSECDLNENQANEQGFVNNSNTLKQQQSIKTFNDLTNQEQQENIILESLQSFTKILNNDTEFNSDQSYSTIQENKNSFSNLSKGVLINSQQQQPKKSNQKKNQKQNEGINSVPQENETVMQKHVKLMLQIQEGLNLSTIHDVSNSSIIKQDAQNKTTNTDKQIPKLISQYNHADQYKMFQNFKKNQENHQKSYEKSTKFMIPKMSQDDVLNHSDISITNNDDPKTPINQTAKSQPQSKRTSIQKKFLPPISHLNNSQDFHRTETIRNLAKFNQEYKKTHKKNISSISSSKIPRKSILKSNTMKIPNVMLQEKKNNQAPNEIQGLSEEKFMKQEMDISDQMKKYTYFYPLHNYQNVINHYNMLKSIQSVKLPSYFNVYSIYNRKKVSLRNQAILFELTQEQKRSYLKQQISNKIINLS